MQFDMVITVCGNANERCPIFPGKTRVVHVPFDDPPALAKQLTDPEQILNCYRKVRDQIKSFVENDLKGIFSND
jgi:arsenate reductase